MCLETNGSVEIYPAREDAGSPLRTFAETIPNKRRVSASRSSASRSLGTDPGDRASEERGRR
jgi:hypothetical protein